VSEAGIGFETQTLGFKVGETIDMLLHMNPSFSLTLKVQVVRIEQTAEGHMVGCQFPKDPSRRGTGFDAFVAFVHLIDQLEKASSL
jgi:hypothetical protein